MAEKSTYKNRIGVGTVVAVGLLAVIVSVGINVALTSGSSGGALGASGNGGALRASETAWGRINREGVIRAGYVSNPPSCIVDPATGKVSGITVEAFQQACENLGLRVEWTEEVGFGTMIEGLKAGRYDAVPCAIWPTGARSRFASFSTALFYSAVGAYVREDDNRFDGKLKALNDPSVTIATMDGEMAQAIAKTSFPKAKTIEVPQTSEITSMLLNVKSNKADVTFVELYFAHEFLRNNPGTLRNIAVENPIRVFPNTILLPAGDPELRHNVDVSLHELLNLGVVETLIEKYEPVPGIFYRVAAPFREP